MPRTLSSRAMRAAMVRETGECLAVLLTLSHPAFAAPIRVTNVGSDVTSRGDLFQNFPFTPSFPRDTGDAPPLVNLTVCNVTREIVNQLRPIVDQRVQVLIEVVLSDTPDTVEYGPLNFELRDVKYDAFVVEGSLGFEDVLNEPFPGDEMNPTTFPGLFT